jgi:hypothetical protein
MVVQPVLIRDAWSHAETIESPLKAFIPGPKLGTHHLVVKPHSLPVIDPHAFVPHAPRHANTAIAERHTPISVTPNLPRMNVVQLPSLHVAPSLLQAHGAAC